MGLGTQAVARRPDSLDLATEGALPGSLHDAPHGVRRPSDDAKGPQGHQGARRAGRHTAGSHAGLKVGSHRLRVTEQSLLEYGVPTSREGSASQRAKEHVMKSLKHDQPRMD